MINKIDELFDFDHLVIFDEKGSLFRKYKIINTPAILKINPEKKYKICFKYEDLFDVHVKFLKFKPNFIIELRNL